MKINRKIAIIALILVAAGINIFPYANNNAKADTAVQIQNHLDDLMKQQAEAEKELAAEQSRLYKNQAQISATRALMKKISSDIANKEAELANLNEQARLNRAMLTEYVRQIYYADQEDPLVSLSLFKINLSDLSSNFDGIVNIKMKIADALQVINDAKTQTEQTKSALADQQQDHQQVLKSQQIQQAQIVSDVQDAQDTLANIQKKFAELQSDLNALLGTNYNATDIKDAVSFASDRTGVPKGVLYGFLKRETDLGKNTGQCTYADVERVSVAGYKKYGTRYQKSISLLYKREKLFNSLLDDLGYKSKKVSCTIPFASAGPNQGGAMGVAQFMSDTWLAYESRISAQTGHGNPDPWNITDGVMALAIKVKGAGGTSDSAAAIRKATINYYGVFSQGYYNTVMYWAKNYKQLL